MIYDNYDNPRLECNTDPTAVDIMKYLPEVYQGSVLITTRSSKVEIGHLIQVTKLVDIRDSVTNVGYWPAIVQRATGGIAVCQVIRLQVREGECNVQRWLYVSMLDIVYS